MSDELRYHDIVGMVLAEGVSEMDAAKESYEWSARLAVAVLQSTGRVKLAADWWDMTDGFLIAATPLPKGLVRVEAVRRGEVQAATQEETAKVVRDIRRGRR